MAGAQATAEEHVAAEAQQAAGAQTQRRAWVAKAAAEMVALRADAKAAVAAQSERAAPVAVEAHTHRAAQAAAEAEAAEARTAASTDRAADATEGWGRAAGEAGMRRVAVAEAEEAEPQAANVAPSVQRDLGVGWRGRCFVETCAAECV